MNWDVKVIFNYTQKLLHTEKGQSMVEYGLIIGIIAVAMILLISLVGQRIKDLYPILEPYLVSMV